LIGEGGFSVESCLGILGGVDFFDSSGICASGFLGE